MIALSRIAALAPVLGLAIAAPLAAQEDVQTGEKINMVIAYDESECPPEQAGVITVCQIVVEADRYRIPSNLRTSSSRENESWAERVETIRYIGEFGIMSCDPAGAGGFSGCNQKLIDQAYAERDASENVRFVQLIEEARQERLSTIDEDAAAEQDRVEQIEREYMERLERERQGEGPGESRPTAQGPQLGPVDEGDDPPL